MRREECAMKIVACAQRNIIEVNLNRFKLMAEQNLQNLFVVKAADIDEDWREYIVLSKR